MISVKRSIEKDFPGEGIEPRVLHQAASSLSGFLAINQCGDVVEFLFDDTWDDSQEVAIASVIANHDHPAIDPAAILALIQS